MDNLDNKQSNRLYSLDALRGFDMFWIIGGESIFIGLASLTGWRVLQWWANQLHHVEWHGFHFYDMIFPLFLFIAGVSFPFSLAKRLAHNQSRKMIYNHIVTRGLVLFALGFLYNNAVTFDFSQYNWGSVLGVIGLGWMFASLIYINTNLRYRIVWFLSLLVGYWLLLRFFPAHDLGSYDIYSKEENLTDYIDRLFRPGVLFGSEGILSTLPTIGTALLGMFTGDFMRSEYLNDKPKKKALYLFTAAIAFMVIGRIWNIVFPINKHIWTSSFVCWAGGLIDVWKFKKWSFFFVVIGMNPITIYLTERIVSFNHADKFFFGGIAKLLPEAWSGLVYGIGLTAIAWVFLYILYKKKIFLKI